MASAPPPALSEGQAVAVAEGVPVPRGPFVLAVRRLARDRAVVVGLTFVAALALVAAAAPLVAPFAPSQPHYADALRGPGHRFLLGTDNIGRDQLSRLLYGARISLGSVTLATAAVMLIGVAVGAISGYLGGIVDDLIQRVVDVLLAFPSLVLALAIAGVLGPSLKSVLIAVIGVHWVGYARLVRGMVLATREQPYVEAARAAGASAPWLVFREILPNVFPPVLVLATLEMGGLLLTISSLSFLGLGAQPPTPEWGTMLNDARPFFQANPHLMIEPGAAIALTVLSFNLIGDGLRDALDPRASRLVVHARRRRWRLAASAGRADR
jgi:peptide/nickel transport system permease protein